MLVTFRDPQRSGAQVIIETLEISELVDCVVGEMSVPPFHPTVQMRNGHGYTCHRDDWDKVVRAWSGDQWPISPA